MENEEEKMLANVFEQAIKHNPLIAVLTKVVTRKGYQELIDFYEKNGIYTKEWLSFNVYAFLKEKSPEEAIEFMKKEHEILFNNISKSKINKLNQIIQQEVAE